MTDNIAYAPDYGEAGNGHYPAPNADGNGFQNAPPNGINGMEYGNNHADESREKLDQKPLKFCQLITERPKLWFGLTLGGQLFFVVLLVVLLVAGVDVLPFELSRVPLEIRDDVDYLRGLAWDEKDEDTNVIERFSIEDAQGERSAVIDILSNLFYIEGGNVLTAESLHHIQSVEMELYENEEYQNNFCRLDFNGVCEMPSSLVRYFDGTYADVDPIFNDTTFSNVIGVLHAANTFNQTKKQFQHYLGKNAVITNETATSDITKSMLMLGYPLEGYANITDREDDQADDVKKFTLDEWEPIAKKFYEDKVGDMEYYYTSLYMIIAVITKQVILDQTLAVGSITFIFVFMVIQTGSFWVTCWSMLSILTGFCTTALVYRFIIDFRYFGVFHVLAVFIVLGIGADDIFVFFDTWKESEFKSFKSLAHRLSYTYRKAARAMFFTSITTATAFIVSATSPFLGVSSFGVFSGILILVNYVSVIVYVPTVIVTYHLFWDKYRCCCCCQMPFTSDQVGALPPSPENKRVVVRFFRGPFFRVITHRIIRWIILTVAFGFIIFFIYMATKLEVQEEQVKLFKENSNFGKFLALSNTAFKPAEAQVAVLITWGVKEQDLSDCHFADAGCMGDTVWDESFHMDALDNQRHLLDFCTRLRDLDADMVKDLAIRRDLVTGKPEVDCFIEDMKEFYEEEGDRMTLNPELVANPNLAGTIPVVVPKYENDTNFNVPITKEQVELIVEKTPHIYDSNNDDNHLDLNDIQKYFPLAVSYWLMNGFDPTIEGQQGATQSEDFGAELGEVPDPPNTSKFSFEYPIPNGDTIPVSYTYGTSLRYMSISVNLTLDANSLGYPHARPIRDAWEDYVSGQMALMPEALQGGVQCTPEQTIGFNAWHWLKAQERLVLSAIIGIVVGICIAFPILIIATKNIIVGLYATFTIIFVTVSVVGFIPLAGWKLGVLESLNLVLVVGLSVDYVVHLAEGYSRSAASTRKERTRDMLEEVGISVLSGAVTTLGASALLLFAQIIFFYQFGIFMFFTILFSILYALILFTTFVGVAGPENDLGSLKPCFEKLNCCSKRGGSDFSK